MALTTGFQSGVYNGTWNAVSIGLIAEAWRIRQTMEAQSVRADFYGDSVIDLIYRGGNAFCVFEGLNWAGVTTIVGGSTSIGTMGIASLGCLFGRAGVAKPLVLTAKTATGVCAPSPALITASLTTMAEGFNFEVAYGSTLRTVPMMLRLLPYDVAAEIYWYQMT